MDRTLRFRLNTTLHEVSGPEESVALDWIRRDQRLTGTKEGCREGDCGACMVLLGERTPNGLQWRGALSCLLALGELDGKHLVTIEGLGAHGLTPVMEAMLDEGASQCGFCTPGFVVSLTAYLVGGGRITYDGAVRAIEGNLCRCTGYGSIQRAAAKLVERFGNLPLALPQRIEVLANEGVISKELAALMSDPPKPAQSAEANMPTDGAEALTLGGGTDYYVRNPDPEPRGTVAFVDRDPGLRRISLTDDGIKLGASVSVQEFFESQVIRETFPGIERYEHDFASLPIRTRATLAGNITNASPIGDMTAILLALGASVRVAANGNRATRSVPLDEYFVAYRRTALEAGEHVESILLPLPGKSGRVVFNFEKVAKRKHLDIASANSACLMVIDDGGRIQQVTLSAGGVAPIPMRLKKCEEFLQGKPIDAELARQAASIAAEEGSPIDDVRGSADYRRVLIERFIWAHLVRFAPEGDLAKELLS